MTRSPTYLSCGVGQGIRIENFVIGIVAATGWLLMAGLAWAGADLPSYQADRGDGIHTSLFGTYVRRGELLF